MDLPAREDVDSEYRFDLTTIFDTSEEWERTRAELLDRLETLESMAVEPPKTPEELEALLRRTEECHRLRQRLDLYAQLSRNVNTDSTAASRRKRELRDLEGSFDPVIAAVCRTLGAMDDATFKGLGEGIEDYRYYAANLRSQANHVRSAEVETVIAAHEEARSGSNRILRTIQNEDFEPPTLTRPDGTEIDIRPGNYRTKLSNPDREYRRRVYEAYHQERNRFAASRIRATAETLAAAATEADVRNYDSIRHRDLRGTYPESGLEPAVPESLHDAILDGVRAHLGPFHRAQQLRKDRLGVDRLRPWDRWVSLADPDAPDISYEEAIDLILESLEPLGTDYVDRTREFLRDRRIDVYPTQDKRTDIPAYCPSSAADGAFILANFRGDVRTTFFLAHELGHALNVEYHQEGPTRYATSPTPICEIPSILHELLLAERCIEAGGPLAAHARNRLVECIAGNLYRNARTAAYNHELATTVEHGEELTPELARGHYGSLLDEFDPVYDREGIPERLEDIGLRIPYSSYQYVLGAVGALAVRKRLENGTLSPADFRQFLAETGRSPLETFENLKIDIQSGQAYDQATTRFDRYLDECLG